MPKKPQKTHEEKIVEEYFPVDETDLKHTIEIPVKEPSGKIKSSVEKEYKKPDRKSLETVKKKENLKKALREKQKLQRRQNIFLQRLS